MEPYFWNHCLLEPLPIYNLSQIISLFSMVACVQSQLLSHVQLFVTPWIVACQAPLSTGLPRQECWNKMLFLSPRDLPDPGIKPASLAWQADSLPLSHQGNPVYSLYHYSMPEWKWKSLTIRIFRSFFGALYVIFLNDSSL